MDSKMTVGVVGAGNMGSGIAQKLAQEGLDVILQDMKQDFVDRGLANIRKTLEQGVERKILSTRQVEETMARIQGTDDPQDLADADLIIEAIFEDKAVKKDLFAKLDSICAPKTVLATNTSSFYVSELAQSTGRPDRFVGMHYFYHPAKNRLLEIIPHEGTSQETVNKALEVGRLHGKTAIQVKDDPGFCVNQFFTPFLSEAVHVLQEGIANIPTIEEAGKRAFKIGMGPFELMNVTGIPIAVHATTTMGKELGSLWDTPELLHKQMESSQQWDLSGDIDESKIETVQDRLYGACLAAAAFLVSKGVASIEDTDRGAKVGLRWAKGPFELMNQIGIDKSYELIKEMTKRYPDFQMPEVVEKQKQQGKPFEFRYVDLDIHDHMAFITFNRPEAMNALNETTVDQLREAFNQAEKNPRVSCIVFQGAGKAFVAGADIRFFIKNIQNGRIDKNVEFTKKGHDLLLDIENSDKRTVAVLDGLSLGGGSEFALACQAIVATQAGSVGFPETAIGIYPGLGGMIRTARQIGPELAKYYVFTGKTLSAQDAYDLGMVTEIVDPQELEGGLRAVCVREMPDKYGPREIPERFQELAKACSETNVHKLLAGQKPEGVSDSVAESTLKAVSKKAPLAVKKANELIDKQQDVSIQEAVDLELGELEYIFSTEDALEGLSSMGKKAPQYQGT